MGGPQKPALDFLVLVRNGVVRTKTDLKTLYRRALKTLHPDLSGPGAVDFDDLARSYREALGLLDLRAQPLPPPVSSQDFKNEFVDLMARGFPLKESVAQKNKGYLLCRAKLQRYLNHYETNPPDLEELSRALRPFRRFDPRGYRNLLQLAYYCADFARGKNTVAREGFYRFRDLIRQDYEHPEWTRIFAGMNVVFDRVFLIVENGETS